jgi:hypothetical protein
MILSLILLAVSTAMLLWWFRYTCGLILSAKPARDYTQQVAKANELGLLEVQHDLPQARERGQLDTLEKKLERDYNLLSYLLRHGPAFLAATENLEQRMLMLDFTLLKAAYTLTWRKWALREMAQVVSYMANKMGERADFVWAIK